MVEKYRGMEGAASPEKWCNISFLCTTDIQCKKLSEAANYLGMAGISFDTGGSKGIRDWETDWSFRYTPGKVDEERREAREAVEYIIINLHTDPHGK